MQPARLLSIKLSHQPATSATSDHHQEQARAVAIAAHFCFLAANLKSDALSEVRQSM